MCSGAQQQSAGFPPTHLDDHVQSLNIPDEPFPCLRHALVLNEGAVDRRLHVLDLLINACPSGGVIAVVRVKEGPKSTWDHLGNRCLGELRDVDRRFGVDPVGAEAHQLGDVLEVDAALAEICTGSGDEDGERQTGENFRCGDASPLGCVATRGTGATRGGGMEPLMNRFSSDSVFWLIISSSFWSETFSSCESDSACVRALFVTTNTQPTTLLVPPVLSHVSTHIPPGRDPALFWTPRAGRRIQSWSERRNSQSRNTVESQLAHAPGLWGPQKAVAHPKLLDHREDVLHLPADMITVDRGVGWRWRLAAMRRCSRRQWGPARCHLVCDKGTHRQWQ